MKLLSLIISLLISISVVAQTNKAQNNDCIYSKSTKSIKTTYPFNVATKIEVISYANRPKISKSTSTDSLIQNGAFIVSNPLDRIVLNKFQTDSLFAILYNYNFIEKNHRVVGDDCYEAKHAIIFYQNETAVAFIELCIDCKNKLKTSGIDFGEFCRDKFCILQSFFKFIGIKHEIYDEFCK
jgi:hypothetical protein